MHICNNAMQCCWLQVNEVHRQFVIALQELFEKNKAKAGYPSLHLQIMWLYSKWFYLALDQIRFVVPSKLGINCTSVFELNYSNTAVFWAPLSYVCSVDDLFNPLMLCMFLSSSYQDYLWIINGNLAVYILLIYLL
jgi:hypothetical protein